MGSHLAEQEDLRSPVVLRSNGGGIAVVEGGEAAVDGALAQLARARALCRVHLIVDECREALRASAASACGAVAFGAAAAALQPAARAGALAKPVDRIGHEVLGVAHEGHHLRPRPPQKHTVWGREGAEARARRFLTKRGREAQALALHGS